MGSNGCIAAAATRCDCQSAQHGCSLSPTEKVDRKHWQQAASRQLHLSGPLGWTALSQAKLHVSSCAVAQVLYGDQSYHVTPYGTKFDKDGTRVTVHIDMDVRQCSFEVDGTNFGVAFWSLPAQVYPAVSMRYGGKVKFITCMGVS